MGLRLLTIRILTPRLWKLFPSRKISSLKKFGQIEKDSANQLLQCLDAIEDPFCQASLFQHVLEELHHHELFDELAHRFSPSHLNEEVIQRQPLIGESPTHRELVAAYAYAHAGESEVDREFRAYARAGFEPEVKAVFSEVAADEGRHADQTDHILVRLSEAAGLRPGPLVFRSLWKLRGEKTASSLRALGSFQLSVLLSIVYFVFGAFLKATFLRRMALDSETQFEIFRGQLRAIESRLGT